MYAIRSYYVHDRALAELQEFVDEQLGTAEFRRNLKGDIENEVEIPLGAFLSYNFV